MAWSTPHTYTVGEVLSAATMNAVRDDLAYLHGDAGTVVLAAGVQPGSGGPVLASDVNGYSRFTGSDRTIVAVGGPSYNSAAGENGLLLANSPSNNSQPAGGGFLFVRSSDGSLCFKGHNGTITVLAAP